MASEVIKLNLIPTGTMPVFHASQFDNGRLIPCELYRGEDAYSVPEGYTVELHCRKRDNNIVTLASTSINDNVVTFTSTTQLTACHGKNLCEVAIKAADDYLIGTLNFYLEVEKDPLEGGINSTSEIHNLYAQVENITTEIISANYYDKTETDALLAEKADSNSVYTIGEVNSLLSGKANTSDVYTKSQTDTLLSAKASITYVDDEISAVDSVLIDMQTDIDRKADASDVYTKSQIDSALALKADASDVYTKTQVDNIILDIMPVDSASGAIATFNTQLAVPLVSVIANVTATGGNGTPDNPIAINGYTEANITRCGVNLLHVNSRIDATAAQVHYTSDDNYITMNGTKYGGTYADLSTLTITLPAGTYYLKAFEISGTATNAPSITAYNGSDLTANIFNNERTLTLSVPTTFRFRFALWTDNAVYTNYKIGIAISTASISEYSEYTGNTYTVSFGQTVYGGVFDVTRGKLTVTHANIASYNGESINEPWLSSMDTYVPNTTPTMGAQVVYPLTTPFDIDLTPEVISAIVGTNNVYSNTGNITVKFKTTIEDYINSHTGG